jgi:hypothetical protein
LDLIRRQEIRTLITINLAVSLLMLAFILSDIVVRVLLLLTLFVIPLFAIIILDCTSRP